jgi:hypothetical protein
MANYPVWDIRLRHEWLATPLRKKRVKRRNAKRVGLLDANLRRSAKKDKASQAEAPHEQTTESA